MPRVVVIGGGISGLTAAYRLQQLSKRDGMPLEITVLESSLRLGGVIQTRHENGFLLESGPDAFLSEKPWALDLCRELGIESEVIGTQPDSRRSYILRGGKLLPVPAGWYLIAPGKLSTLLGTPIVSWPGKLRMACELLVSPRSEQSDESVGSFIRRRFGNEALARVGQPMIGGIYAADPDALSLQACMPQLREMEAAHGSVIRALGARARARKAASDGASGPRYALFVTLKGGIGRLVESLQSALSGADLRTGSPVERIWRNGSWRVGLRGGEEVSADAVCLAIPACAASPLLGPMAASLSAQLKTIVYESVATINLAYRRSDVPHPLDGFGVVIPQVEGRPLIGVTFSSMKFAGRAPESGVLFRAFVGGAFHRNCLWQDDAALTINVRSQLAALFGIRAEPLLASIARYERAMPQYAVGHLDAIRAIESQASRIPGLFLAGNAYRGIGIPDCVRQAGEAAQQLWRYLRQSQGAWQQSG
jgi:oxygen-dependent protoporphyrinogen oxidase